MKRFERAAGFAAASAIVVAAFACCAAVVDLPLPVSKDQDGISADLSVTESDVQLRWRFAKKLSQPLDRIVATVNGRPLGVPTIESFVAAGQTTAVIALLDISGLQRLEQIERFKMTMLLLAARKAAHTQLAFAVYALEGSLLVPASDDPKDTLALLAQIPALDEEANLSGALISSVRTLEKLPADRRAIYVLSDGHNDSTIAPTDLAELARSAGVALFFLVAPSDRAADLPALSKLSDATGGELVEDKNIATFLGDPFALMDSGARLRFPLEGARRFFWESQSNLQVVIHYGDKQLEMNSSVAVAPATLTDTVVYAWQDHPSGVFAAGGLIALVLGGAGMLGLRRRGARRRPISYAPQVSQADAVLQDIESGAIYLLKHPLMRIGRNSDNDIVLDDPTIGRSHAIVQRVGERVFTITDQSSANGTLVNGVIIDTAKVSNGDVISIGAKTLRFSNGIDGRRS